VSTATPSHPSRHQNLYAHHLWRQQRFFAGLLLVVGALATGIAIYQRQLFTPGFAVWLVYIPTGLLLGAAILLFRQRSHIKVEDDGLRISSLISSVVIDYDSIKSVKALPLRQHFQDKRSRMIAPIMKQHIDQPAVFLRIRDETIAIPVPDADTVVWEISSHLPEKIGQNQGGARRRKRRR